MKVIKWWKLSSGESYLMMKVILRWKLSRDESYLMMKVILWWKLSNDESYQVMKVKEVEIAKKVIRSDGWWRFACGNVWDIRATDIFCVQSDHFEMGNTNNITHKWFLRPLRSWSIEGEVGRQRKIKRWRSSTFPKWTRLSITVGISLSIPMTLACSAGKLRIPIANMIEKWSSIARTAG